MAYVEVSNVTGENVRRAAEEGVRLVRRKRLADVSTVYIS